MIETGMGPVLAFWDTAIKWVCMSCSVEAEVPRRHSPGVLLHVEVAVSGAAGCSEASTLINGGR